MRITRLTQAEFRLSLGGTGRGRSSTAHYSTQHWGRQYQPTIANFTFDTIQKRRLERKKTLSWIKNKILTQKDNLPKLEFAEISPKNKDKLLSKYKASF